MRPSPHMMGGLLAATLVASAGCGDDANNDATAFPDGQRSTYTAAQVIAALDLRPDPNADPDFATGSPGEGLWEPNGQCIIHVVMTSPAEVSLYAEAGDVVASNPSGAVGVKVGTYQGGDLEACHRKFTQRLAALD